MGIINKLFGPSKLQEEFNKSLSLKWQLIISSTDNAEFYVNQTAIRKKNSLTTLHFDFDNKLLFIKGDLFKEIIFNDCFEISRVNYLANDLEIYLSGIGDLNKIVMKCIIYRNYILFQGTLSNWHCKISNIIVIGH